MMYATIFKGKCSFYGETYVFYEFVVESFDNNIQELTHNVEVQDFIYSEIDLYWNCQKR